MRCESTHTHNLQAHINSTPLTHTGSLALGTHLHKRVDAFATLSQRIRNAFATGACACFVSHAHTHSLTRSLARSLSVGSTTLTLNSTCGILSAFCGVCMYYVCVCLCECVSLALSLSLFLSLSVSLFRVSVCVSVRPSLSLSVCLSVCVCSSCVACLYGE